MHRVLGGDLLGGERLGEQELLGVGVDDETLHAEERIAGFAAFLGGGERGDRVGHARLMEAVDRPRPGHDERRGAGLELHVGASQSTFSGTRPSSTSDVMYVSPSTMPSFVIPMSSDVNCPRRHDRRCSRRTRCRSDTSCTSGRAARWRRRPSPLSTSAAPTSRTSSHVAGGARRGRCCRRSRCSRWPAGAHQRTVVGETVERRGRYSLTLSPRSGVRRRRSRRALRGCRAG